MTFIQRPQTLADENYNFRIAIDRQIPDLTQDVLCCLQKNAPGFVNGNNNSIFNAGNMDAGNNALVDKNGVKSETSIFSSYKAISNLTPEQKKKLDDCANEIAKINELKIKLAKEQEENEKNNKTNTKTLEKIFEENNLSTTGLSEELKNTTDYDKIQEELDKALDKKRSEQEALKKEFFGEEAPSELEDIKIENIDKTESRILSDLMKDEKQKYEKASQIAQKLKETQDKMNAELEAVSKTTSNQNDRAKRMQDIQNRYRKDISSLLQQKAKADIALEKARLKVTEYGQKAAKDDKTIGLDGKEVRTSVSSSATPTTTPATTPTAAPATTPTATPATTPTATPTTTPTATPTTTPTATPTTTPTATPATTPTSATVPAAKPAGSQPSATTSSYSIFSFDDLA